MLKFSRGFPVPYGPSNHVKGINFALFSKSAEKVTLCLFKPENEEPIQEIVLDPKINKTGNVWHIFVYDVPSNYHYAYRLGGLYEPLKGLYYDERLHILDPYCKQMATTNIWGASQPKDISKIRRGMIAPIESFHWDEDKHPRIPMKDLIIYEMHVRGFTHDPSSNVENKGTFLGIVEKIPYLKSLGVNAIELLPIHEFYERQNPFLNPKTNEPLYQYWGYSTINFFSPMNRYGIRNTITEFKNMVKALHANGIEVILDVVYNHSAEGDKNGPILSFKGIENPIYHMLGPNGEYYNFTGCGNTMNGNHPVTRELIRDSLRYWVLEMHVDGFRFDLASALTRGHDGIALQRPPLIEMIAEDPLLSGTKMIAEAWDAGGLYQVGSFPSFGVFSEWNGKFRDDTRSFIKGTDGTIGAFATRITGSEDLYGRGRNPTFSINFITSHDGFSLADLVSYNEKHNEENGEENRDGDNNNLSWNCGGEGDTEDPHILDLRRKQMKNFILALFISEGVPMLVMGDEYGHSKKGNNNTWGHDSRLNWFQWDTLEKNQNIFRFTKMMIEFRKQHSILTQGSFRKEKDVIWHGKEIGKPSWDSKNRFLAFVLPDFEKKYELYVAFNADGNEMEFALPEQTPITPEPWGQIINTSKNSPKDFVEEKHAEKITTPTYTLPPYSSALFKRKIL